LICGKLKTSHFLLSSVALPVLLALAGATGGSASSEKTEQVLESQFKTTVKPFVKTYCVSCHGKDKPQAQLDLSVYTSLAAVSRDFQHWTTVLDKLDAHQMPPAGSAQPSAAKVHSVVAWVRAVRQFEIERNAGDPGPVTARRLSNSEYDYTIRDLTGQDLKPTKEFPVDPANQEGFDNSCESLTISPALMKKYMQAARDIADHLVLTSTGIEFASHPVLVETDRDKFCILRIVDYYKKQPTDYADYFQAAYRYQHRAALGQPNATLQSCAAALKVSPRYLELVWKTLNEPGEKAGPINKLQSLFAALPAPHNGAPDVEREGCVEMRDWVTGLRKKLAWKFQNLRVPGGFSDGGQCFVLWKDRQYASHRRMLYPKALQIGGIGGTHIIQPGQNGNRTRQPKTVTDTADPDLYVPQDETARPTYMEAFNQFCNVFPDAFYISERGRMFMDDPGDKGRLLTAGLHNSMGYFRDDTPLMELVLDDAGRDRLEHMWLDFNQVAFVPERMHIEFFHYERAESGTITSPEFNFVRAEDKDATSDAKIKRFADVYLAKAKKNGGEPLALQAIEDHFKWVSTTIRATERGRVAAEPLQIKALLDFARRAYRRPLTDTEHTDILGFYQMLRKKESMSHEDAMRDSVVSILMSPKFLFRIDLGLAESVVRPAHLRTAASNASDTVHATESAHGYVPLSDYALASRLSYFLWASMPDDELLKHAAAGDLHRKEVLLAQSHRMLKDPRIRALAVEFGGNWLDYRRFEEHNAVDRNRFPSFTDDLREAMYQEPVHFLVDQFQNDRPILDLLYARHTFVNATLAKHYGIPGVKASADEWVKIDNASKYGRGGLLPMALFLTKNAPGLRTSPVKRGYWVVRRVLGEVIPAPPPNVPLLPTDESKMGNLTLRQALEQHRSNPACAGCHARFDSYGLVFEGYGPIGELRTRDLGGKPVDASAPFPGGVERTGVTGLQEFVRQNRQQQFLDTYGHKLLSYALGRSLQPSDDPVLTEMQKRLAANGYRFGTLVDSIVSSTQFRNRRAPMPTTGAGRERRSVSITVPPVRFAGR